MHDAVAIKCPAKESKLLLGLLGRRAAGARRGHAFLAALALHHQRILGPFQIRESIPELLFFPTHAAALVRGPGRRGSTATLLLCDGKVWRLQRVRNLCYNLSDSFSTIAFEYTGSNVPNGFRTALERLREGGLERTERLLYGSTISAQHLLVLEEQLRGDTQLKALDVACNGLYPEGIEVECRILSRSNSLTALNVWNTHMGEDGAAAMARALRVNRSLEWLNSPKTCRASHTK
eukprot:TRINITY_DN431_c1_g2_i5.p1 TRINITY_DN431_c1_g2~~TRINITY_DN431_c1_g2_i5.p1  ORF type:complete len:235 (+),score=52.75 TRINITY_DN431_c1_g2_i5:417-1121(+)